MNDDEETSLSVVSGALTITDVLGFGRASGHVSPLVSKVLDGIGHALYSISNGTTIYIASAQKVLLIAMSFAPKLGKLDGSITSLRSIRNWQIA